MYVASKASVSLSVCLSDFSIFLDFSIISQHREPAFQDYMFPLYHLVTRNNSWSVFFYELSHRPPMDSHINPELLQVRVGEC